MPPLSRQPKERRRARLTVLAPFLVVLAAVLALSLAALSARADDAADDGFAELEVVAYGAQRFDLATGFTELPDGGEVVERGTGVRLSAPWLRYAEGDRLEARDASVTGAFGVVLAPLLTVDIAARRLYAEGGVTLDWDGGAVVAAALTFDVSAGWLWLAGDVHGSEPELEAAAVGYEVAGGRVLLLPPYLYVDGPIRLRADVDGAPLQLTPERDEAGAVLGYDASTQLDADVADALAAQLDGE